MISRSSEPLEVLLDHGELHAVLCPASVMPSAGCLPDFLVDRPLEGEVQELVLIAVRDVVLRAVTVDPEGRGLGVPVQVQQRRDDRP